MKHLQKIVATSMAVALVLSALFAQAALADPRDFTLENDSYSTVRYVYVSAANDGYWGSDVLGYDVLLPGERVHIYFDSPYLGGCLNDIKVVTASHRTHYLWSVDMCSTTTVFFSEF
jgi:hypothetical protein